jgi:hypothetical protein
MKEVIVNSKEFFELCYEWADENWFEEVDSDAAMIFVMNNMDKYDFIYLSD